MENWTIEQWNEKQKEPVALFYLYTPMCGTCAVASKMIEVVEVMKPDILIGKADLQYVQQIAIEEKIESVPCLLIHKKNEPLQKIYAFHSVPYLLTLL